MDEDAFEEFDRELELALYREYRDIVGRVALRTWPLNTFGPLENQTSAFRGVPEAASE